METNKRQKLKSDEFSQVQTKSWLLAQQIERTVALTLFLFLQAPVAGNEADMDVDTNSPRNGLHFWLHNYFCCLFFGRRFFFCIANSGNVSIDVRPTGAYPTVFFFSFFFFPL
jgi:predicted  nucleic acid-binding Zn ribbon protein